MGATTCTDLLKKHPLKHAFISKLLHKNAVKSTYYDSFPKFYQFSLHVSEKRSVVRRAAVILVHFYPSGFVAPGG
jgi:hypothetical protein